MLALRFCALAGNWRARAAASLAAWALVVPALSSRAVGQELPSQSPDAPASLPAGQQIGPQVTALEITGNRITPRSKIVQKLKTRAGRTYDVEVVERDVRELNRTGLFVSVFPRTRQVEGGVIVTFEVVERPTLQYVKYFGNDRIRDKKLAETTKLKKGDPLSPFEIEEGRRKIEQFYRDRGFYQVQVTVVEGAKSTDQGAVYLIHEGEPQKVLWTSFEGNTIVSDARLKTQIQSKPGIFWIFKGQVDPKKLDEDVERITAYYRSLGYFRARVGREYKTGEEENWVNVKFYIYEGPRYQIRNISFNGNQIIGTPDLAKELQITGGKYFDQAKLNKDLAKMRDQYGSQGYVFADIKADPRFLEEPGQLDLVYNISEGDKYRIGKVNVVVEGEYPHTRRNVVLNHLSIRPGDIADIREIRKSQVRLQRSGLFEMDPTRGVAPKIAFTRPEDKEAENVARKTGERPKVRGQSPDEARGPVLDVYEVWRNGHCERIAVPREQNTTNPSWPTGRQP
jgi:outer membrane protein insertion porin family